MLLAHHRMKEPGTSVTILKKGTLELLAKEHFLGKLEIYELEAKFLVSRTS